MRTLLAAACLATALTPAFGADRWQAVLPALGKGAATCFDPDIPGDVYCAALLCDRHTLSFGVMGYDKGEAGPAMDALIDIDGVAETRRMESRMLAGVLLQILTPISPSDALYQRLISGKRLRISMGSPVRTFEYTLDGADDVLPPVSTACER